MVRLPLSLLAQMLLKAADGSALKNEKLQLFVSYGDKNKNQTFLTDDSGRASFELDTSGWTRSVTLRVSDGPLSPSVAPALQPLLLCL